MADISLSDTFPPPSASDAIRVVPSPDQAGQRIDRLLADSSGGVSRSRVKTLIEEGALSRDGAPVTEPAEPARAGARYTLVLPPPVSATPRPQVIPFPILFEDRDLIVLDKPAGLVVHPAPGNQDGTLVNALLAHCGPGFTGIGAEKRPGIVHRLDKDTSGVMVVAKTQRANDALTAAFAARDLDRAYLALEWFSLLSLLESAPEQPAPRTTTARLGRLAVESRHLIEQAAHAGYRSKMLLRLLEPVTRIAQTETSTAKKQTRKKADVQSDARTHKTKTPDDKLPR